MKPITRYLPRELGQLAYDDSGGDGRCGLAIAGMGDLRDQFRALRLLLAAGWRVITVDARGQGESSIFWQDYSAQACARDVLALLDALGIARAVLIGHSFAAGVACLAAALAPQRVQAQVWLGQCCARAASALVDAALAVKIGFAGHGGQPWLSLSGQSVCASPRRPPGATQQAGCPPARTGRMRAFTRADGLRSGADQPAHRRPIHAHLALDWRPGRRPDRPCWRSRLAGQPSPGASATAGRRGTLSAAGSAATDSRRDAGVLR